MLTKRAIWLGVVLSALALTLEQSAAQDKYVAIKERAKLKGHTDDVLMVSFRPDGEVLASSSKDKTIRLWDVKSGTELMALKGLDQPASALAFSVDGNLLASGDRGKTIRLWDMKTGKELHALAAHEGGVRWLRFTPDGKTLASTGEDRVLRLWNVGTGQETKAHKAGGFGANAVAFSPDGKTLAYGEGSSAYLLDLATDKATAAQRHGNAVLSLTFSLDGKVLITGGYDDKIKVWTVKPLKEKQVFSEGHVGGVGTMQFTPDGKALFTTGAGDGRFLFWNAVTGKTTLSYAMPLQGIATVAPTGKLVASSDGSLVKLWDVPAK